MKQATKLALERSIIKWQANTEITDIADAKITPEDCPLCNMFWSKDCVGCPIMAKTERRACWDTPYIDAAKAWSADNLDAFKIRALREVDFLKSLLP